MIPGKKNYYYIFMLLLLTFIALLPLWSQDFLPGVASINKHRNAAGLQSVIHDNKLSSGCMNHARYLTRNSISKTNHIDPHTEDKKLPGYTKSGAVCADNGAIISVIKPTRAVDYWMATLFHRIPFLDPHLEKVGFGTATGGIWTRATAVDIFSGVKKGRRKHSSVMYPGNNQKDIPLTFGLQRKGFIIREHPNPLEKDKDGIAGYPVTLSFYNYEKLTDAHGQIEEARTGMILPSLFTSPEEPSFNRLYQQFAICIIPSDPLKPETTYRVSIDVTVNKIKKNFTWSFTTGKGYEK